MILKVKLNESQAGTLINQNQDYLINLNEDKTAGKQTERIHYDLTIKTNASF